MPINGKNSGASNVNSVGFSGTNGVRSFNSGTSTDPVGSTSGVRIPFYNPAATYAMGETISGDGTNGLLATLYTCKTNGITGTFDLANWVFGNINARAFGVVGDGVTDDTVALNAATTFCRINNTWLSLQGLNNILVSNSIDVSGVAINGDGGIPGIYQIQATSDQFDVLTTTGETILQNINIHGGWDGVTAGLDGDILSTGHNSYNIHIMNCVFQYAKKRHIYINCGAYTSIYNLKANVAGLHGIELFGNNSSDTTTTIFISGASIFSDCPNGYGAVLTNCVNVSFNDTIIEYTNGIQLNGDSRSLSFYNIHQEATTGSKFITWSGSSGQGLLLSGCFGAGLSIDYNEDWIYCNYLSNNVVTPPYSVYDDSHFIRTDGAELTTTSTGSFTAVTMTLPVGTWLISITAQTLNSSAGVINKLAGQLTANNSDSGLNNSTSSGFNICADEQCYNPGTDADLRISATTIYNQNTGGDIYLRLYLDIASGTVAYKGAISATKL